MKKVMSDANLVLTVVESRIRVSAKLFLAFTMC